ncbi:MULTISPECIES: zf-HC2 domain-containing protein [Clostridia]|nr:MULTISPECIES: zf-HC2 domain-containing protein [Clostridia]
MQKILQENLQWKTAAKNYSTKKTGGKSMNCQTAESMVNRYIEHDLSVNELEDFLDHVENCPSCYDELETYFIVHAAMRQLDEESGDSSLDLRELLEDDIRRSKHYILKMKFRRALSGVGFCTLIAGLGGFLIYIIMQTL